MRSATLSGDRVAQYAEHTMDGLNVEQQQTRGATALKTGTLTVTQQNAVSKNADWNSVFRHF